MQGQPKGFYRRKLRRLVGEGAEDRRVELIPENQRLLGREIAKEGAG